MARAPIILVVDDEPDILATVRCRLESRGYQVETAENGLEALTKVAEGVPDLLILDARMPELGGYEVCRRLRADPDTKRLPIVMLTAMVMESDRRLGQQCGATVYLAKPFEGKELLDIVTRLVGST